MNVSHPLQAELWAFASSLSPGTTNPVLSAFGNTPRVLFATPACSSRAFQPAARGVWQGEAECLWLNIFALLLRTKSQSGRTEFVQLSLYIERTDKTRASYSNAAAP